MDGSPLTLQTCQRAFMTQLRLHANTHNKTRRDLRFLYIYLNPLPTPGYPDFSRSGKSAAEFAQEPSQFARMAPGPSTRRGRLAPPTPRIWLTAGALLAVACQGGGERPLEISAGLSLDPRGVWLNQRRRRCSSVRAGDSTIRTRRSARTSGAVGQIRTSGAVPRAPGG